MEKEPFTRVAGVTDKKWIPVTHADVDSFVRSATNSMPVYMQHVKCSGGELSLLGCSFGRNLTHIDHSRDVAVKCKKCKRKMKEVFIKNSKH